jgi:hypothetical protein
MNAAHAHLEDLLAAAAESSKRFEAQRDGGGSVVQRRSCEAIGASLAADTKGLAVNATDPVAVVEFTPTACALPTDWQAYDTLKLQVRASTALLLTVGVIGARGRLERQFHLQADEPQELPLDVEDLPLAAGNQPLYEPTAIRLRVEAAALPPAVLVISTLILQPRSSPPAPVVDRFGQRRSRIWARKISAEAQLQEQREAEGRALAARQPPLDRDDYGGWTGGERFEASGFFRLHHDTDGRWWFVNPDGHPYLSIGPTGLRLVDATRVDGREHLFEALPPDAGVESQAWIAPSAMFGGLSMVLRDDQAGPRSAASFSTWNVLRKYAGDLDAWRDRVLDRLRAWGFTSVGCFSTPEFLQQRRVPHVAFTRSRGHATPLVSPRMPDVFDPAWEQWLDRHLDEWLGPDRDNPWRLGIFIDNEMPWRNPRLLDAPTSAPLRDEWVRHLRNTYANPWEFADACENDRFETWEQIRGATNEEVPAGVREPFEAHYADTYAATIKRLLRKHAPNHLYLGCRFTRVPPAESIVRAIGSHVDVLSVNCYSKVPERDPFDYWHAWSGKPILIGEHHWAQCGPRQAPPLWPCFEPQERERMYVDFVRTWLSRPYALGCHWFQWFDQHITGRPSNGENQIIGLVDVTDQPHDDLLRGILYATARMYQWHAD